jgi:HEAT repeat protein
MVTLAFLSIIRDHTYRVSGALFAAALALIVLSAAASLLSRFAAAVKARSRRKLMDALLRYTLSDDPAGALGFRQSQRRLAVELFSSVISSIKGRLQVRLKTAVSDLGLIGDIERDAKSILPSKRLHACHKLGILESKASVPALTRALGDRNPKVRASAVLALGAIHDEVTIPPLLRYFAACSYSHAWLIADLLPLFGAAVYRHSKPYLEPGALSARRLVLLLKVIASVKAGESYDDLHLLYTVSDDIEVRINALVAIGRMNDVRAVKTVLDALVSPEWRFRAVSARIIGEMSIKRGSYRLIPLVKDDNWHVRRNAAEALAALGSTGLGVLLACLDLESPNARDMVVQALEEKGLVDQAVADLESRDAKKKKDAVILVKSLVRKGYTNYLTNFEGVSPTLKELIAGCSHG